MTEINTNKLFLNKTFRKFILSKIKITGVIPASKIIVTFEMRRLNMIEKGNQNLAKKFENLIQSTRQLDIDKENVIGIIAKFESAQILYFNEDFSIFLGEVSNEIDKIDPS